MKLADIALLSELGSAMYGVVAAVLVTLIIKGINKYLDKDKEKFKENFLLRKELREEMAQLKKEVYALQEELDEWKTKYYDQVQLTNSLRVDILKLTEELNEYKNNTGTFDVPILPRAD